MQRHDAEVAGETIAWYEEGDGTPVVLIHGIPTGPLLWRRVVPLIEGGRSLAFEMAGYASSASVDGSVDVSVAAQGDWVVRWMDALHLERVVLVGHDLGGGVAQIAAVRHPERCAKLVLTDSIGYDSWPIPSVKAMTALAPLVQRMPDALFRPVLAGFIRIGHDDAGVGRESASLHWRAYDESGGAAAFVRQIRSLNTADTMAIADLLPRLEAPARVVWGAGDPFQKIAYGERLANDLQAPLTRIDGARHFVPEDHPGPVAAAINQVISSISTG